jgi:hypothetical protein
MEGPYQWNAGYWPQARAVSLPLAHQHQRVRVGFRLMYRLSQRLAWVGGVVLPVGETFRRWGTWWDYPPAYLDDVLIGGCLLAAAAVSRRNPRTGHAPLAAAWGLACGIGFMSLSTNIVDIAQPDPSGVSGAVAVAVKAVMMLIAGAALAGALQGPTRERAGD